jgi:RHS repeat-associated protein
VVLNRGGKIEVRSDRFELEVGQRLFTDYPRFFTSTLDVDVVNQRVCTQGSIFEFTISQDARVTLEFTNKETDDVITIVDDEFFAAGEHELQITPLDLFPGTYDFELSGVAVQSGITEVNPGGAYSHYKTHDNLPVGHTLVKGVNVFTGGLTVSSNDLSVPGRGLPLEFTRTYSSSSSDAPGALGYGWNFNYDSKIIITPCGEAIVIGAQGGGMRFVEDADGRLKPLKGYHGTLIPEFNERVFNFYSKDGTLYRYRNLGLSEDKEWNLEYAEDTNGNWLKFGYDPTSRRRAKLITIEDGEGRTMRFTWKSENFADFDFAPQDVIEAIDIFGPDGKPIGMGMTFDYDEFGNLEFARREQDSRVESYEYSVDEADFDLRHKMKVFRDGNQHETLYDYSEGQLNITDSALQYLVPLSFTDEVTDPEGGVTIFDFSKINGTDTTTVKNGRGFDTHYRMNDYGSVLEIDDPAGITTMTWTNDDNPLGIVEVSVLMTSRTDANGVLTEYQYDEDGNLEVETVTDDDTSTSYTITRTYRDFPAKPWIKNRVETETDRNGNPTQYFYDDNGNLEKVIDAEDNVTEYGYNEFGDRTLMIDPEGNPTTYRYLPEDFGKLSIEKDAFGFETRTRWNVRGLLESRTDKRKNTTHFEYDTLNYPEKQIDPYANERTYDYDPVGNKLFEKDERGNETSWAYDGENRLETVTNDLGDEMSYTYDEVGNRKTMKDWRGNETTYVYDAANRLKEKTQLLTPLNAVTRFDYDPVGNLIKQTDAEGRETEYDYDLLNRQIEIIDAEKNITYIGYDGVNRISQTDPLAPGVSPTVRRTSFEYDKVNRLRFERQPLGRITEYRYDRNGNRELKIDPNGNPRKFDYDELNRLKSETDALGNETIYGYDPVGNRTSVINARLHESTTLYDKLNRPIEMRDQAGNLTVYDYDEVGNRDYEEWPNGNVIITAYDALNRPTTRIDSLGSLGEILLYDENGNVRQEKDARGNLSVNQYDELNRRIRSDLPEARTLRFEYDRVGNLKKEINARGFDTDYEYDGLNRVEKITDVFGNFVFNTYDPVGNRLSQLDKRGNTTSWEYDELNRVKKETDALGQFMEFDYDLVGNRILEIDKRKTRTVYDYDELNRLERTTKDNLVINVREYDEVGNLKFDTDANGNITGFIYDKRNLLQTESRELAAISHFSYDAMGDRETARDPEGRTTTYDYDQRRRLKSERNDLGETTFYDYDLNGNRTGMTRPKGNAWSYEYDGADRLERITDGEGGFTAFTYDKNDNRESQTDAMLYTTSYLYDELDRLDRTTYADGAFESYDYDANGNRTLLNDARGQQFIYDYDELNREKLRLYPAPALPSGDDIQSIATGYDANNNPKTITETFSGATGTAVTSMDYDNFDRLQRVTDRFGKTIRYAYDANGNRTRLTDPDGKVTTYSFDKLNRVKTVTTADGISVYEYDRSGLQTGLDYPNGTRAETAYDDARRVEQIVNRQGAAILSQYDYLYDANGNRTSQTEINGGAAEVTGYDYDLNDRLQVVDYPDALVEYEIDANYNRERERSTDKASGLLIVDKTYAYNNRNQLTGITDNLDASQNVIYQYDLNGNQTIKSKNGVTKTFIYDVRDQLVGVREDATTLGQYRYDYSGMRIEKTAGGETLRYTYDDSSVLLQFDSSGATLAKYEYGPDRMLSLNHASEGRQFYHFDALGSTVNLSKPDASLQARYQYDAWGNFRTESGSSFNAYTFTGHEKDRETDLFYFKARYYDPDTGRFLTQDAYLGESETPPSLHRYLYAYSNPIVYIDLTGYNPVTVAIGEYFDRNSEGLKARNQQLKQEIKGEVVNDSIVRTQAIINATASNIYDALGFAVGLADTALDLVPTPGGIDRTKARINNDIETIKNAKEFVTQEGALGITLGVVRETKDQLANNLSSGDFDTYTQIGASFVEILTGTAITKVTRVTPNTRSGSANRIADQDSTSELLGLRPQLRALHDAGLDKQQRRNIVENSAGIFDVDNFVELPNGYNVALTPFSAGAVKPKGSEILGPLDRNESFNEIKLQAQNFNAKVMDNARFAELDNLIPELKAADQILFFTKPGLMSQNYLTAREMNYVLSNKEVLNKTNFVTGFLP